MTDEIVLHEGGRAIGVVRDGRIVTHNMTIERGAWERRWRRIAAAEVPDDLRGYLDAAMRSASSSTAIDALMPTELGGPGEGTEEPAAFVPLIERLERLRRLLPGWRVTHDAFRGRFVAESRTETGLMVIGKDPQILERARRIHRALALLSREAP